MFMLFHTVIHIRVSAASEQQSCLFCTDLFLCQRVYNTPEVFNCFQIEFGLLPLRKSVITKMIFNSLLMTFGLCLD